MNKRLLSFSIVIFFLLLFFSESNANSKENSRYYVIETEPTGLDIWQNNKYLGKTPGQFELDNNGRIFVSQNPLNNIYGYLKIFSFPPSSDIFNQNKSTSLLLCNIFFDCNPEIVEVNGKLRGYFPKFTLDNNINNTYSLHTTPNLFEIDIFADFTDSEHRAMDKVKNLFLSPNGKYLVFFAPTNGKESVRKGLEINRELFLYLFKEINHENNQPIFARMKTKNKVLPYHQEGLLTHFSANSKWLSFCITNSRKKCQFYLLDLENSAEDFLPIENGKEFDECVWHQTELKVVCRAGTEFDVYDIFPIKETMTVKNSSHFGISTKIDFKKTDGNNLYFAGDIIVWQIGLSDEVKVYSLKEKKVLRTFKNSSLIMITYDGKYISVTNRNYLTELGDLNFTVEEIEKIIIDQFENTLSKKSIIYNLLDVERNKKYTKLFSNDSISAFSFRAPSSIQVFQKQYPNFVRFIKTFQNTTITLKDLIHNDEKIKQKICDPQHDACSPVIYTISEDFIFVEINRKLKEYTLEERETILLMYEHYSKNHPEVDYIDESDYVYTIDIVPF